MVFAIEEINKSMKLLPNITLGFEIYDSCILVQRATEGTMWLVTGHEEPIPNYWCRKYSPLAAVIGDGPSLTSIPIARLLGIYNYPQVKHFYGLIISYLNVQNSIFLAHRKKDSTSYNLKHLKSNKTSFQISYASTVVALSDKQEFPSFFRNIPSDDFQSVGLAWLVIHFGWTWVGLLAEDTDYGQGIQTVKEEIVKAGGCIAFSEKFPAVFSKKVINYIIQVIKMSTANAIVVYANEQTLLPYMEEISMQNISGKVWLSSEAWTVSFFLSEKDYLGLLSGTIGIMNRKGIIPGFQEYLYSVHPSKFPNDIFIKEFWEKAFGCRWSEANINLTVSNDGTIENKICTGEEKLNELNNAFLDASSLRYTYNVYNAVYTVAHALHDMYACKLGEGPFVGGTCANIMDFEPWQVRIKATECFRCPEDHWSNERQDKCIPKAIEFLSFKELMGATLLAISVSCASLSTTVLCIFVKYRDTPIVKANNRELSYLLLLALILSFFCSLIFIGEPTVITCMLRQAAFGIIFALCVSCVLAKTIMVVIAFNATKPNSHLKKWVGPKLPKGIVFLCTIIQVIICNTWLTSSPPFPERNIKSKVGMIIVECNEGSTIAFWCVLGYMGILAIVSFIVAFLARNLPGSFNEAKFMTFSMLVFVSVWLAFIPAYLSTRGKYMVAVEIFAILASSAGLLASSSPN
ncbi:vomeronasal type-2 receptor 1 [Latimeria chalumnae]|uniref:vomeronasal type-2 receptor 1 n=1 Tax=Latimeria chalumnae TaxID=7897 RepID=UPI00313B411E